MARLGAQEVLAHSTEEVVAEEGLPKVILLAQGEREAQASPT